MAMSVVVLRSLDALRAYAAQWDSICQRDPLASIQRSWFWQYSWASVTPGWAVAVSLDTSGGGAILPFQLLQHRGGKRELRLGGSRLAAIGGLLSTDSDDEALVRIARYLRHALDWDRAFWDDVGDPRLARFAPRLSGWTDTVRLTPCNELSVIDLPATWDAYLASLGHETRANLRKRSRQAQASGLRVSTADAESVERFGADLLLLWQRRWGAKPARLIEEVHTLYRLAAAAGHLRLTIWHCGQQAVAGLAGFCDPRGTFHCFMSAHDPAFRHLSPSKVAMADAIRWSIENGYRAFSFGRGQEEYKRSLNAQPRPLTRLVLARTSMRGALVRRLTSGLPG